MLYNVYVKVVKRVDLKIFFLVIRTFKIYSLYNFHIYIIINYSHHAVHYIPVTYLFNNWKFVPFDHLHPFCPFLTPCLLAITNLYSVSLSCLVGWLVLDSTCKWDHTVLVFLCLTVSLSIMPSRSIHVVSKGKIILFSSTMMK